MVDEKFITKNFTGSVIEKAGGAEKLIAMLAKEIPSNDGVLTVYSVNRPTTFKYEYTAKGSKSGWLKIVLHMDNQDPYRIKGFELELTDAGRHWRCHGALVNKVRYIFSKRDHRNGL